MRHILILANHRAPAADRLVERITAQLAAGLGPDHTLATCTDARAIASALLVRPDIVLAPLAYESDGGFRAAVNAVRLLAPDVPIVACCDVSVSADALLVAAEARVDHFAVPAVDDMGAVVRDVMSPDRGRPGTRRGAASPGTHADAFDELLAAVPSLASRLLMAAVSDRPPRTVAELAAGVGLADRTLTRRCARHGWPTPTMILRYGRLVRGVRVALATGDIDAGARAAECADQHGRAATYFRDRLSTATNGAVREPSAEGLAPLCRILAERFGVAPDGKRPRRRPPRTRHPRGATLPPDGAGVEEGRDD